MPVKHFYTCLFLTVAILSTCYGDWRSDANSRIEQYRKGDFRITAISPYGSNPPLPDVQVDVNQLKHQFAFGSCINGNYSIPSYATFFKNHFEWAVCENETKWMSLEPSKDSNQYGTPDSIYTWCNNNGIIMRGHCLFWEQQSNVQDWVKALDYKTYPQDCNLLRRVDHHILDTVNHYKNKFRHWDIDNEMLPTDPCTYRFYDRLGTQDQGRVHMFQYANTVDPNCKLFMNEYSGNSFGGWTTSTQSTTYRTRAASLIGLGAPVQALGIQGHLGLRPTFTPQTYWDNVLKILGTSGLPIWVSEFDANEPNDIRRAGIMDDFYRICFSDPNVGGIIMWGFWQTHTWQSDWYLLMSNGTTINQTGQRYESLLNEWTTRDSLITDDNGDADFRGFYGKYRITLNPPEAGPNTVTIIDVLPGGPNEFTITLTGVTPINCQQVHDLGLTLDADLNSDCYVDYQDLDVIADYWLEPNCVDYDNCEGADFNSTRNGTVDFADFGKFGMQWTQCNDPNDPNCGHNW